jgi:hypothetical protein
VKVSPATKEILDKAFDGAILTREEILEILRIGKAATESA